MQIVIVNKNDLNGCWSSLQYTDNCHQCDKVLRCKIKSQFHINGLLRKESFEIDKILSEHKTRLENLKETVQTTLSKII